MKVELLIAAGCPHVDAARRALAEAVANVAADVAIDEVDVDAPDAPEHLRGWASPTILIDGVDLEGLERGIGAGCRIYDGSGGAPSAGQIEVRLRSAARRGRAEQSADEVADTLLPESQPAGTDPAKRPPLLLPGSVVDQYEITAKLGAGGMSIVYRARDRRLGRDVAIKIVRTADPEALSCRPMCALLLREAQISARVTHPNLVAIHGVGQFRGCVYLAMELVDGQTLREWNAAVERPWRERLTALIEAGRGLAEAHASGVVHRDFKPDNVMVSRRGRVQVTDFGLAWTPADVDTGDEVPVRTPAATTCNTCFDTDAAQRLSLDHSGYLVGTPAYMAPEQIDGRRADHLTDQFAFAVTAWEVLHGAPPFRARTLALLRAAQAAPPDTQTGGDVPAAVDDALRRGLACDPSARFQSLEDLLIALESALRA